MTLKEAQAVASREYLRELLKKSRSMKEAALIAGCNRTHFYRLCHKLGVEPIVQSRPIPKTRTKGVRRHGAYHKSSSVLRDGAALC